MRRAKYGNRKAVEDGVVFDSERERKRYCELKLLERAGVITDLRLQPRYPITIGGVDVRYPNGRHMVYLADFQYVEGGKVVVEDCKGFRNAIYRIKKALMSAMGIEVVEI